VALTLTAALSFAEWYTVSLSFRSAAEHQVEEALGQHQMVKFALQSGMLAARHGAGLNDSVLTELAAETAEELSVSLRLAGFYENTDAPDAGPAQAGALTYALNRGAGGRFLSVTSGFSQSGYDLTLTTVRDVSALFAESEALQASCRRVFLTAIGAGSVVTLVLSWLLTRPIKRLDDAGQAFIRGDRSRRLRPTSRDEIGDLTRTYNVMADTVQEKIDALEQEVRQREDFIASFAHELKTPMTSIIGYADVMWQRDLTKKQVREAAGYILNEGMRLEALSFKLLELIALEKQDFLLEEMETRQIFRDLEESIAPNAAERGVEVSFQCENTYVRVEFDLCKTMLLNLLDNALKSGGSRVLVTGRAEAEGYLVKVMDNGRGIPPEELRRVTEAFYMVDKSRSRREHGAGLGLALCERIAALHGTHLSFESVVGSGTMVCVRLPLSGEGAGA